MAQTLLEPFDLRGKLILADKGYDSNKFVRWIESRGGIVIIPFCVGTLIVIIFPLLSSSEEKTPFPGRIILSFWFLLK